MVRLNVEVNWIASVEKDCALYNVPPAAFEDLCELLRENPLRGSVVDASGLFETDYRTCVVRYFVTELGDVTIMQLRPTGTERHPLPPVVRKELSGLTRFLLRQGVRKWLGL